MTIFIEDSFDSAHWLPNVPDTHKCRRMHGHTYRVRIEFEAEMDERMGWLVDYGVVKPYWAMVRDRLDHRTLNEVLPNPTCELIAEYIAAELQARLDKLGPARRVTVSRIELRETERCGVVWRR